MCVNIMENENDKPSCTKCGSMNVYVRIDGTYFCRRCGYLNKKQEEINNE